VHSLLRGTVDANNNTLESLTQRLIKEESRMSAVDEASGAAISIKPNKEKKKISEKDTQCSKKEVFTCFYC